MLEPWQQQVLPNVLVEIDSSNRVLGTVMLSG